MSAQPTLRQARVGRNNRKALRRMSNQVSCRPNKAAQTTCYPRHMIDAISTRLRGGSVLCADVPGLKSSFFHRACRRYRDAVWATSGSTPRLVKHPNMTTRQVAVTSLRGIHGDKTGSIHTPKASVAGYGLTMPIADLRRNTLRLLRPM